MAYIDAIDTYTMPVGVASDDNAYSAGINLVGPLSLSISGCEGLSSVAAVVVVWEPLDGGTRVNISGIGAIWCCNHRSATEFSSSLIKLGSKVAWPQSAFLASANSPPSTLDRACISNTGKR